MRGSIQRRSPGSWSIRVDLPDEQGGRRQKRVTIRGTRRDAEKVVATMIGSLNVMNYAAGANPSLSTFFEQWLTSLAPRVCAKTFERYRSIAVHYLIPSFGATKICDLRPIQIDRALATWAQGPRKDRKCGMLSDRSVRHIFETLRTALNQAKKWGLITSNPCVFASPPKKREREIHILDPRSAQSLFAAISDKELLNAVMFDIATGLRRGEILALTWSSVDWNRRQLYVGGSLEKIGGKLHVKTPKTRTSRRLIPLTQLAIRALCEQKQEQQERLGDLGVGNSESIPIFDYIGGYWDPGRFSLAFYRTVKRSGVPKVRFHDLRHSFASILLAAGVDLKVISELLGHSEIAITANLYVHLLPVSLEEAAAKFDAIFTRVPVSTQE